MSPGINVCTRKWHPQHAEIAQIKQKGPGQLLLSYLSTCSNRLLQFCNLHSLSWVDLHWSLINCRLRILGLGWEKISTLKIMRSVPASLALNLCLTQTNIDWQANSNITFYTHFQGLWYLVDLLWSWRKHRYRVSRSIVIHTSCTSESSYYCLVV